MIDATPTPSRRLPLRWWSIVAVVFVAQVAAIYWLGERHPPRPEPHPPGPSLEFARPSLREWIALEDPSLFALPRPQSFSGLAWLTPTNPPPPSFDWSDAPEWLPLDLPQLGLSLNRFLQTNTFGANPLPIRPNPVLTLPALASPFSLREKSQLSLAGELAGRPLLNPVELPSPMAADLLTNSVVRVIVDADGRPTSATLLGSCGQHAADLLALQQAWHSKFSPLPLLPPESGVEGPPALQLGLMIFEWHTLPLPPTNSPAGGS